MVTKEKCNMQHVVYLTYYKNRGFPNHDLMIFVWICQLALLSAYKAEISQKLPLTLNNGLVTNKR